MTKKPYIIGIAGGSGSGKSTAVINITGVLPSKQFSLISQDSYYKDQSHLSPAKRAKLNFDHPNSLETSLLVEHVKKLKQGLSIQCPQYDFTTHSRITKSSAVQPNNVIIVDGILIFDSKELRELFDLKIFIDTPDDIRFIRRLQRDIAERGRTMESVIEQYQSTVRPMYLEFVEPSKRWADVIIPEGGRNWAALDLVIARVQQWIKGK